MESQKLDDALQLALSAEAGTPAKESGLYDGYDEETDRWELIVKYNGSLERYRTPEITVEELIAGYAIVTLPPRLIEAFSRLPQIEYVEKPQKLLPQMADSLAASCFPLPGSAEAINGGRGVWIAVIDSGIDYTWEVFREASGKSRIAWLYDQETGRRYDGEEIDASLGLYDAAAKEGAPFTPLPGDRTGHGTGVAAIAAGAAPGSRLVVVKLARNNPNGFILTTNLMRAVTYVLRRAAEEQTPVAVNISYGNSYGSHDGTSLLERFLDNASELGRSVICVGMGNEGASGGHFSGRLEAGQGSSASVPFAIGAYERSLSLQVWSYPADRFGARLISPTGQQYAVQTAAGTSPVQTAVLQNTHLTIFAGTPTPYQTKRELYVLFSPRQQYIDSGEWRVVLTGERIKNGFFQMYLPAEEARGANTRFLQPNPSATVTIPATAQKVISVGAYSTVYDSYASFSGRGMYGAEGDDAWQIAKPDLVAPGIGIAVKNGNAVHTYTGTSFATPFVTAAAAILMQWGLVDGNDPYLYGEKCKAYLQSGARSLPFDTGVPNAMTGWGRLCLRESLPR